MIKSIKKAITTIFSCVYKVISLFNLQYTLLALLVGLILFFAGVFEKYSLVKIIYFAVVIATIFLAGFLTIRKLFATDKKKEENTVQIISQDDRPQMQERADESVISAQEQPKSIYPKYYNVKKNKNYLMAEYEDRYELYLKTTEGLKKIRTDYK